MFSSPSPLLLSLTPENSNLYSRPLYKAKIRGHAVWNRLKYQSKKVVFYNLQFFILQRLFQVAALNSVIAEQNANCQVKIPTQLL